MCPNSVKANERYCTEIVNDTGIVQQIECFIDTDVAAGWGDTVVSGTDKWRIRDKETNRIIREM